MERVIAMTETRLLNERGRPYFDLSYYAINKKGEFAGAVAYEGSKFAVCDAQGPRLVEAAVAQVPLLLPTLDHAAGVRADPGRRHRLRGRRRPS